MKIMERGTGITTRSILNAPDGAVYVWCNSDTWYPKTLAADLGRKDLKIVSQGFLDNERNYWNCRSKELVIDHACELTERQRTVLGIIYDARRVRGK